MAIAALLALLLLGAWLFLRGSLAQLDGHRRVAGLSATVSVARDDHGVPLIRGANRLDVAYATGYVHAQERYFQMDLLRRSGAGELAEMFGPRAVPLDQAHRLHRFRARAELALLAMPAADRLLLERYTAGVNDGLGQLSARPFEYVLTRVAPRAWSPADSLLCIWAMYFDLQGGQEARELARGWLREHSTAEQRAFLAPTASAWDAPLDADRIAVTPAPMPATPPAWWGRPKTAPARQVAAAAFLDTVGSNNWAVAGARNGTGGGAIVSDDMHLGLQLPATWYRLALQFPDAQGVMRRVVGVTLPGMPLVVAGSNGRVAWGYTNSYGDYLDLIALDTDAARPGKVRTQAGWETPAATDETILVKGAPAVTLTVRETTLGPLRVAMGRSYAIHWSAHAPVAANANSGRLETADTLDQALAIAPTLGIPAQNFVAGDAQGNIGWTIAGPLPRRAPAGDASTYPLAADDPAGVWDGWLAPDEYPRVRNPAGGQLATANSRQLAGAGAELIGDGGFDLGARTHQVRDNLTALGARTDVAAVYGVTLDDRAIFMGQWRERAIAALSVPDADATAGRPQRAEALRLLRESWSGRASVDSVGYRIARGYLFALYDIVYDNANGQLAAIDARASMAAITSRWPVVLARLLDEQPAAWLPPSYADWRQVQLAALDRVIADLSKDGEPLLAATWGRRNTAPIAHPIAAALPALARWLSAPADMLPGDSHMPRVAGPKFGQSERMTVQPGREEQGLFNMPGGQSGHPLSPYFLLGHADWVRGTATPLLPGAAQHTLVFSP